MNRGNTLIWLIPAAIAGYVKAVKAVEFPAAEHGFSA